jgi:hypothetical protein
LPALIYWLVDYFVGLLGRLVLWFVVSLVGWLSIWLSGMLIGWLVIGYLDGCLAQ